MNKEKKGRPFSFFLIRIPCLRISFPSFKDDGQDIVVAIDSTGVKVTNRGGSSHQIAVRNVGDVIMAKKRDIITVRPKAIYEAWLIT